MQTRFRHRQSPGFTVIELLVVVAIIALLVAMLLPSLQQARAHAKTVMCSTNMHHVGTAMANYLYVSGSVYPASYLYPSDDEGTWSIASQEDDHPFGYLHWSHFMYADGEVGDNAFKCPMYEHGGAPRTNPGLDPNDWEAEQVDQNGSSNVSELTDKQARRMSYTANAAIMPRNKFTTALSGGNRVNQFVKENNVTRPGDTILLTEFLDNWKAIGIAEGGTDRVLSKSHRPINPFFHISSSFNEYAAPVNAPGYIYGIPQDQDYYGLLPYKTVRERVNILDHSSGMAQINAVGRHHPTADQRYRERFGGEANFLFCDGHVDTTTVLETVDARQWGDRYYSVSGSNAILNMSKQIDY
jgi:prepilin-type N-terminal cleavage/methylation domain-containing protein/prepilin-type processing-associated H-X9-DG protein